jgi:hypothetical protein
MGLWRKLRKVGWNISRLLFQRVKLWISLRSGHSPALCVKLLTLVAVTGLSLVVAEFLTRFLAGRLLTFATKTGGAHPTADDFMCDLTFFHDLRPPRDTPEARRR